MPNKPDQLKIDIARLTNSIDMLETKLAEIDAGNVKHTDPALVATLIESKDRAEALLSQKQNEFRTEQENARLKSFGGLRLNADDIARLSIGGSLKTSSLDKTAIDDDRKKQVIDDIFKKAKDEKDRVAQLLDAGFIVQRKM